MIATTTTESSHEWSRRALFTGAGLLAAAPLVWATTGTAHAEAPISWSGKRTAQITKSAGTLTYATSRSTGVHQSWVAPGSASAEFSLVPTDTASTWELVVVDPQGATHRAAAVGDGALSLTLRTPRTGIYAIVANLRSTSSASGTSTATYGGTDGGKLVEDFSDVSGEALLSAVRRLQETHVTHGYVDGEFKPHRELSRGEAAAFVQRGSHHPRLRSRWYGVRASGFSDVPTGHSLQMAVGWAKANGVTSGFADGTFRPDRAITRGEFTKFLWSAFPQEGDAGDEQRLPEGWFRAVTPRQFKSSTSAPFADVPSTHTFYDQINWLRTNRIVGGYTDGTFRPSRPITRGEAAQMISPLLLG